MRIGYACLTVGVPDTRLRTCTLKNAREATLRELMAANLTALARMLEYNRSMGIRLFRISSDIVPFASHPAVDFPWAELFRAELAALGALARAGGIRLSMHPGQYTVLNSPDGAVVERAVADLDYHCRFLEAMGMGADCKVILHVGGAYGDRGAALDRFRENYAALAASIRKRLVIENDDRIFTAGEVLALGRECGIPVVFDNLHHAVNPGEPGQSEAQWIAACGETWTTDDGPQKIHYSQQAGGKKPGAHSDTVRVDNFLDFAARLPGTPDVMLEVKDKNLSAVKCILCLEPGGADRLAEEWTRYRYAVLECSPEHYRRAKSLLQTQTADRAVAFYRQVEAAMAAEPTTENATAAALRVWEDCRGRASEREERRFASLLEQYRAGSGSLTALKRHLLRLAEKYGPAQLPGSCYFLDCAP